jgi:hypothetical protein
MMRVVCAYYTRIPEWDFGARTFDSGIRGEHIGGPSAGSIRRRGNPNRLTSSAHVKERINMTTTTMRLPSFPESITVETKDVFWKQVSDLRKEGWKPSPEEKMGLNEAYAAFGKALGLERKPTQSSERTGTTRRAAEQHKAKAGRFSGKAPVEVIWTAKVGTATQEVLRTKHATLSEAVEAMPRTLAKLAKDAETSGLKDCEIQSVIKHHPLQSKVTRGFSALRAKAAHAAPATPSESNLAKRSAAAVLAPKGIDPVKAALKAALQGLNATTLAITAALEAL